MTERWRYFTISKCREALIKPIPSEWDPRARLREGFKINKDALISELKFLLQEMVDHDAADVQIVERLAQRISAVQDHDFLEGFEVRVDD
ncbi:hypothetical protein H2198_001042 [Neophaeococcomyces mojaviensis]|uniref:Uncharacterized protein n=1 Tax=Neophaeococcomyces mojaviensis TaxID=3383035 RepID=A0ACC3AI26_9EURO|nr:hypothetical protein H2198_001042 [Knufia sp. JES_112]